MVIYGEFTVTVMTGETHVLKGTPNEIFRAAVDLGIRPGIAAAAIQLKFPGVRLRLN